MAYPTRARASDMVRHLDVWLTLAHASNPIGTLTQAEGCLAFSYRPEWLASDNP